MEFILGSQSALKIRAAKLALEQAGFAGRLHTTNASSRVSAQPLGWAETLLGAKNRARSAQLERPEAYGVGIENGLRLTSSGWVDWAIVVVLAPDQEESVIASEEIVFPRRIVARALACGITAGEVLSQECGASPNDPHLFLTGGKKSRSDLLVSAILSASQKLFAKTEKHDESI